VAPAVVPSGLETDIRRYDDLIAYTADSAQVAAFLAKAENELQIAKKFFSENETALTNNKNSQPRAEQRLYRNANPRFLHYMQFNREEKVKRLTQELQALKEDEQRRTALRPQYQAEVNKKGEVQRSALNRENQIESAQREMKQIFEKVVDSQHPTAPLISFNQQLQAARSSLNANNSLMAGIQFSAQELGRAQQLFSVAQQELQVAMRDNQRAKGYAVNEMNWGDYYDENMEIRLQRERDNLINRARQQAFQAGQVLQAAFDAFPIEARVRYPELTRNICNAPIPNLQGANFGKYTCH